MILSLFDQGRVCVGAQLLSCVWCFLFPWPVTQQAPLSMGFSRQEYWSGLPFPSPADLPIPGIKSPSLKSLALAGRFFTTEPPWSRADWPNIEDNRERAQWAREEMADDSGKGVLFGQPAQGPSCPDPSSPSVGLCHLSPVWEEIPAQPLMIWGTSALYDPLPEAPALQKKPGRKGARLIQRERHSWWDFRQPRSHIWQRPSCVPGTTMGSLSYMTPCNSVATLWGWYHQFHFTDEATEDREGKRCSPNHSSSLSMSRALSTLSVMGRKFGVKVGGYPLT